MRACIFETSQSKSEKKKKNAREGERAIPSKFIRAQLSKYTRVFFQQLVQTGSNPKASRCQSSCNDQLD